MVADALTREIIVVVYDPTLSEWSTDTHDVRLVTCEQYDFLAELARIYAEGAPNGILAIIDEADTMLSQSHRGNWWLFTRGRHFGIECIAITQRPKLIAPTIRSNTDEVFVFNTSKSDASDLADDRAAPELIDAPKLAQGEFFRAYWKNKNKIVDKLKIF